MATETGNGGGGGAPGSGGATTQAQFLFPQFVRMPGWYPYAGLGDQMLDAYQNWQKGAGAFANNAAPIWQSVKNGPAAVGGGLLGKSAYGGGPNPFGSYGASAGAQYTGRGNGMGLLGGGANFNFTPTMPGNGPAGTPTIPTGYQPGQGMTRPSPYGGVTPTQPQVPPPSGFQPFQQPGSRVNGGAGGPAPTGAGARSTPASGTPGVSAGGAPLPYSQNGLLNWQNAQQYMDQAEKDRLSKVITNGQYNPGQGNEDIGNLMSIFNSLDEQGKGDFTNAIGQYKPQLAAAMQQAGRQAMGQSAYDNWYAGVQNRQGSNYNTASWASKAPWLAALLK